MDEENWIDKEERQSINKNEHNLRYHLMDVSIPANVHKAKVEARQNQVRNYEFM